MDNYLDLVTTWLTRLGMAFNLDKLKRQLVVIAEWFKIGSVGVFEAVTGFGKSMVGIIIIRRLNLKYPTAKVIIVVPSLNLKQDWNNHVYNFGLQNVEVYVINTYVNIYIQSRVKHKCALLLIDEVHNVLSEEAKIFNQTIGCTDYDMFLGLSATLNEEETKILEILRIPIFDKVTMAEARKNKYISDYITYNLPIQLDDVEREVYNRMNDIHNSNFAKFHHFPELDKNYELARACSFGKSKVAKVGNEFKTGNEWRLWYANKMDWDGTDEHMWSIVNINKYAQQWNWAVNERKSYLYNHHKKLQLAKQIIERFNVSTITFAETTDFADKLTHTLGNNARSYHSNIESMIIKEKKTKEFKRLRAAKISRQANNGVLDTKIIEGKPIYVVTYEKEVKIGKGRIRNIIKADFEAGKFKVISTAKALDEGFNVEGIDMAIICSASSKRRQSIQRMGRALRYIEGKKAKIFNLYIEGTQDETWLKKRQKGDINVQWIKTLDEVE